MPDSTWSSIGQRKFLSKLDIARINRRYKCPEEQYYVGDDIPGAIPNKKF